MTVMHIGKMRVSMRDALMLVCVKMLQAKGDRLIMVVIMMFVTRIGVIVLSMQIDTVTVGT